jgi:4-hydroxy-tetrahydrodipicolinate synthase
MTVSSSLPRDLRGVFVPLVTPFTADGAVDERSFVALVEWLLSERVHGFVLNGTTGESPTVSWPEVEALLRRLIATAGGRVPVLVGTGTYDTAESVERTTRARALGADGALAVVPYYSRPAPAGVIEHFRRIAAVGLPLVAYNIPYRTGLALSLPTLRAILALPGVVGIKESSGGVGHVAALAAESAVLCGEDHLFLPALAVGAAGGMTASANVAPRAFVEVYEAFTADRPAEARARFAAVSALVDRLFAEPNPAPLKWTLAHRGLIASGALRLPMVPISDGLAAELAAAVYHA